MKEIRKSEYDMLREASWKRMEAQRNISFFSFTSSITILGIGFAIENINKYIFLLPLVVLIPFALKTYQCKKAIACIASYMIVFLESGEDSYHWETDSYFFKKSGKDFQNKNIISSIADAEFFFLGIVSWGIYTAFFYQEAGGFKNMMSVKFDMSLLLLTFLAVCFIFYITKQYSLFNKTIKQYIKQWNQFAYDSGRISYSKYSGNIKNMELE
ncbi:hypothetical protein [Frisingicoccus sp.]|uniref:hypothetical protein n=1 Tax=Frisingicoccus sp. TaxID=1918627 RepID=UPI003AB54EA8